jgi:sarcosine oxidase delta subunit
MEEQDWEKEEEKFIPKIKRLDWHEYELPVSKEEILPLLPEEFVQEHKEEYLFIFRTPAGVFAEYFHEIESGRERMAWLHVKRGTYNVITPFVLHGRAIFTRR